MHQYETPQESDAVPAHHDEMSRREFIATAATSTATLVTGTLHGEEGHGKEKGMTRPTLTPDQVKSAVAERAEGVDFADIQSEQCVDGRGTKKTIGVPGGDPGRLLAQLSAVEQVTGKPLSREAVHDVVQRQVALYIHTDSHAEHAVQHAVEHHPTLKQFAGRGIAELYEKGTGDAAADRLLAQEIRKNLGCGHLKGMMADAAKYGVRPELVKDMVEETLLRRWNGKGVTLEVLEGDHGEQAVAVVRTPHPTPKTRVATLNPNAEGKGQMFVNHPDVTAALMDREVPALLALLAQHGVKADPKEVRAMAGTFMDAHTNVTVGRLAKGLPVDEIICDPHNPASATVKQVAVVPEN